MERTIDETMTESERAELEREFDHCLVEIKQLHDECDRLGVTIDQRLRRIRQERERFQAKS